MAYFGWNGSRTRRIRDGNKEREMGQNGRALITINVLGDVLTVITVQKERGLGVVLGECCEQLRFIDARSVVKRERDRVWRLWRARTVQVSVSARSRSRDEDQVKKR